MKKLIVLLFLSLPAFLFSAPYLYISHNQFNKISIMDTANNAIVTEVTGNANIKGMKLSPDSKYLYFASSDNNSVYRMKTSDFTVGKDFVNVGYSPIQLAIKNDNSGIIVSNSKSNNISFISLPDFKIDGEPLDVGGSPRAIALSEENGKAFVALWDKASVAIVSLVNKKVLDTIPVGDEPWGMAIKGDSLYVTNSGDDSISVINVKTGLLKSTVKTSKTPRGIAIYNDSIYVTALDAVEVYDADTLSKTASIDINYVMYDCVYGKVPAGDKIFICGYIADEEKGKVSVIDPSMNKVIYDIDVPGWPFNLEIGKTHRQAAATPTIAPAPEEEHTAVPVITATAMPTPIIQATPTITATATPKKKSVKHKAAKVLETARIEGDVFIGNDRYANAVVKAINSKTNTITTTTADNNGHFVFEKLSLGAYIITIDATALKNNSIPVTAVKGKNNTLTIKVEKR
jgi:YVTN family beta-propeller protein